MELTEIGYFSKTHGVKGQLILKTERDFDPEAVKAVFIESPTGKAPYFISEIKESNNGLIVNLEDVLAIEKAKLLLGKKVFIDAALVEEEEVSEWLGFEVIDKQYGSLGIITSSSDNGSQQLINLLFKGKEIILPLVDDFIESIDETAKKLYFNAPEGLIDVYLGDEESSESEQE